MKNFIIIVLLISLGAAVYLLVRDGEGGDASADTLSDDEQTGDTKVEFKNEIEGGPENENGSEHVSAEEVREQIQGTWRNEGDTRHTLTFNADGTLEDSYASGAVIETGTFSVYSEIQDLPREIREGSSGSVESLAFLREVFNEEEYCYAIREIADEELVLVDLESSEELSFTRIDS